MVRAEDGSIFGSFGNALSADCKICGNKLNFKENKDLKSPSNVLDGTAGLAEAKHCGYIYMIGAPGSTFTISTARDPKFVEAENKLNEKANKANKLRAKGKAEEAAKLEDEIASDSEKLQEQEGSDEPKAFEGGRAAESREEEKGRGRPKGS